MKIELTPQELRDLTQPPKLERVGFVLTCGTHTGATGVLVKSEKDKRVAVSELQLKYGEPVLVTEVFAYVSSDSDDPNLLSGR